LKHEKPGKHMCIQVGLGLFLIRWTWHCSWNWFGAQTFTGTA